MSSMAVAEYTSLKHTHRARACQSVFAKETRKSVEFH
jgi:hypothetical protein